MDMPAYLQAYMRTVTQTCAALPWEQVARVLEVLHAARLRRAMVFICGNGGSAATAMHFVNDLNKGAGVSGVPRFRAVGLQDNLSLLTAWSNDVGYDESFVAPLRNLARPGDVLIGISGSGNSPNVLNAVRWAHQIGMQTIGFAGFQGGQLAQVVDLAVIVPNTCMEQIEDVHMFLEHATISALRTRAQCELVPGLLVAGAWSAGPGSEGSRRTPSRRRALLIAQDLLMEPPHAAPGPELALLPGAIEALVALRPTPWTVCLYRSEAWDIDYELAESAYRRTLALIAALGGHVESVAWCPHQPTQQCLCRRSRASLLAYVAEQLNLDLGQSYLLERAGDESAAGAVSGAQVAQILAGSTTLAGPWPGLAQAIAAQIQESVCPF